MGWGGQGRLICITFQNSKLLFCHLLLDARGLVKGKDAKEEKTKGNILGIPYLFLAPVGFLMTWEVLHPHPLHLPSLFLTFLKLGQCEGLILV